MRRLLWTLVGVALLVVAVEAAIAVGTGAGDNAFGGGVTVSHTCEASSTLMIVALTDDDTTPQDNGTTVTWNTTETLTEFAEITTTKYLWVGYRINPTATTANVVASGANPANNAISIVCLQGTATSTPLEGLVTESAATASPDTNTVTSEAGDLVITVFAILGGTAAGITAGGTTIHERGSWGSAMGMAYESGAASVDADWSWSTGTNWAHAAFNVNAPAAGGSTACRQLLLMGVGGGCS